MFLASVTKQDLADSAEVGANLKKALLAAPKDSNPYITAAKYVSDLLEQRAPLTAVSVVDESQPLPAWLVAMPVIFLIAFTAQIVLSGLCLVLLSRREKFWLARVSKTGIFILNTRTCCLIMASLFSMSLSIDLIAFLLAIFDVEGADSRLLILSMEWLPCFLAGWIFLWGLASGAFEAAYEAKHFYATHKASKYFFNFFVILLPSVMTISQLTIFVLAQRQIVASSLVGNTIQADLTKDAPNYDPMTFNVTTDILPKLLPIKDLIPHETKLAAYLRVGRMMWILWAVVLMAFTVPLVVLHLRTLKQTIRKIARDCHIDIEQFSQLSQRQAHNPCFHDQPFSGWQLSTLTVKQQKSINLQERFRAERRANKVSLAIFLAYLSVYLFLSVANRATSGMSQYDKGAGLAVGFLIVAKSVLALLGLLITLKFYRKLRTSSKEALAQGSGSVFGAGMQFHKEVSMIIEDAELRRVGGNIKGNYAKYEEW